jgi:hypothetical protein
MAKDHYVPRFYLRNFQIPGQPGLIYSYARNKKPIPITIRKVAQEEDYYDLKRDDPTVDKEGVDKLLWMTEDKAAPIINKFLSTPPSKLTGEERGHFCWFVGLLAIRTPFMREQVASTQIALRNRDFKKMLKDDAEFQKLLSQHPESDAEELKEARQAFLNGDLELTFGRGGETEDWLMAQQLRLSQELTKIIQQRYWNIIETDNWRVFLTSDNPVVTVPVSRDESPSAFGYLNANILLPLSPKRALFFTHKPLAPKVIPIKEGRMRQLQFYTITQCNKYVYSHIKVKEFQRILDKTEEGKVFEVTIPE